MSSTCRTRWMTVSSCLTVQKPLSRISPELLVMSYSVWCWRGAIVSSQHLSNNIWETKTWCIWEFWCIDERHLMNYKSPRQTSTLICFIMGESSLTQGGGKKCCMNGMPYYLCLSYAVCAESDAVSPIPLVFRLYELRRKDAVRAD